MKSIRNQSQIKIPEALRGIFRKLRKMGVEYEICREKNKRPMMIRVKCPYGDVYLSTNASYGQTVKFRYDIKQAGIDLRNMTMCVKPPHLMAVI
tara:strand:- start:5642 stop:5923 length:282 start_codon:yes stop_codon:yes gene_type:complete